MATHEAYLGLAYGLGVAVAVAFALYALAYGFWWRAALAKDTEAFITARGTQSLWRIGWSFFAGAVGAWVIVVPAQYASFAGIIGLVVYALATALPIAVIAVAGPKMAAAFPRVVSLADFIGWRFGPVAKTLMFAVTVFNMAIALLAEYTTIGSIFADFVGSIAWPIIIVVGVLTLIYTAYGGLGVSIATDQAQGAAAALLTLVLTAYVAATFRAPIPSPLPDNLGPNYLGYASIFTMGASMMSATLFSEAVWQRAWASASPRALAGGAAVGFVATAFAVFLAGFGGWLAFAGNFATFDTNPNVILMQLFGGPSGPAPGGLISSWVGLLVVLLAIVMNEGAVDSLQNGLAAAISGHFLRHAPLLWTRLAVLVLNVPLIIVAARGYSVLSFFLVANLITTCGLLPVAAGLWPRLRSLVSESCFVFGYVAGVLGVTACGIGVSWVPGDVAGSFATGAYWAWVGNQYDVKPFAAALTCSFVAMVLWSAASLALRRFAGIEGPGVSGVLMRVPGMRQLTATPHWPRRDYSDGGDGSFSVGAGGGNLPIVSSGSGAGAGVVGHDGSGVAGAKTVV